MNPELYNKLLIKGRYKKTLILHIFRVRIHEIRNHNRFAKPFPGLKISGKEMEEKQFDLKTYKA